MKINMDKAKNTNDFDSLECGDVFIYYGELHIKTRPFKDVEYSEYTCNAVLLSTGDGRIFDTPIVKKSIKQVTGEFVVERIG